MNISRAAALDLRRMLTNHQYERAPGGRVFFPKAKAFVGGVIEHDVNGRDLRADPNVFTTEGLNYLLDVGLHDDTKVSTWYFSLFTLNVTPTIAWTAANYNANATEFTNYDEAARPAYVEAAASGGAITNTANKATFTMAAGTNVMWGGALLSVATKGATTGKLLAAAAFSSSRTLNTAGDQINMGYTLTLTAE